MEKNKKGFVQEEKNLEKVSGGFGGPSASGGAVNVSTNVTTGDNTLTGANVSVDKSTDNSTNNSGNGTKAFTNNVSGTNSINFGSFNM